MIRQRFNKGRWTRIAAWTTAAVIWTAAFVNNQPADANKDTADAPEELSPEVMTSTESVLPSGLQGGLQVLRYSAAAPSPPPTIIRHVTVEERVTGQVAPGQVAPAPNPTPAPSASAPKANPAPAAGPTPTNSPVAAPPPPPPPPPPAATAPSALPPLPSAGS